MELSDEAKLALRGLLEQSDLTHASLAAQRLAEDQTFECFDGSLKELTDIYSFRAIHSVERGSKAVGWSELVCGLQSALLTAGDGTRATVCYSLEPAFVLIFTDAAMTKVLGVRVNQAHDAARTDVLQFRKELQLNKGN